MPGRGHFGNNREANSFHLPRTIENQPVQQLVEANRSNGTEDPGAFRIAYLGHDFSRIPVHGTTSMADQPGATAGKPATKPSVVAPFPLFPAGLDFTLTPIHPTPSLIPRQREGREIDLQPPTGGPRQSTRPSSGAGSCGQPRNIIKVTSGPFLGGRTIASYFPDLAARGYPASAGPFDLGNRAGSSVQLVGVIPSPCEPSQFTVAQTYNVTRARFNGSVHALEGQSGDDIARSGRDASRSPFRQEFLGGGTAPLGYIISFADPPSIPYGATTATGEFDANFVSSLVGPAGRRSVDWSVSVRIAGGHVTTNTVT
jgi:hypothetical protein